MPKQPPPPKPPVPGIFDWRRQVLQMVIFVAFVAALGYAASRGALDYLSNEVTLTVEPNRTQVTFGGSEPPVIQLHIKLKNNTEKPAVLKAESPCKVLRWLVTTPGDEFVQARGGPETQCAAQPIEKTLAPGEEIEEFYALILSPERFGTGGEYVARVRYWGYDATFNFTVPS